MYLSFERVVADATVKTVSALTVPAKATHAELQADTTAVRYTMDNSTAPSATSGMQLLTTSEPKLFLIADLKRIKFTRGGGADGGLNIHYLAGRDV